MLEEIISLIREVEFEGVNGSCGKNAREKIVKHLRDNSNRLEKLVIKGVSQPCAVAGESNYKKGFDDAIKAVLYAVKDFGYEENSYLYDSIKKLQD